MSLRTKRVVGKPTRYQTTSSEEEVPKRQRTSTTPRPPIDQDIHDLRMVLQEHGSTTCVPTVNANTTYLFQDNYAAAVPVLKGFTDPGTSYARATVIHSEPLQQNTAPTQPPDNGSVHDRIGSMEAELTRMNTLLESVLQCVQPTRNGLPRKPAIIPLSSPEEVDCFETIDDETYSKVVQYFKYVGGFNLKAAVDYCMKEALIDDVTTSFTWFGRTGQRPFYNTRITMAIYEAVSGNPHFDKPLRSDFQVSMQRALRTAKERVAAGSVVHGRRQPRPSTTGTTSRRSQGTTIGTFQRQCFKTYTTKQYFSVLTLFLK